MRRRHGKACNFTLRKPSTISSESVVSRSHSRWQTCIQIQHRLYWAVQAFFDEEQGIDYLPPINILSKCIHNRSPSCFNLTYLLHQVWLSFCTLLLFDWPRVIYLRQRKTTTQLMCIQIPVSWSMDALWIRRCSNQRSLEGMLICKKQMEIHRIPCKRKAWRSGLKYLDH